MSAAIPRSTVITVVVATTVAQAVTTMGAAVFPVIAPPLADEIGVAPASIGYLISLAFGTAAFASPFMSFAIPRWGACRATQVGLAVSALAMASAVPASFLGLDTELGRITSLVAETETGATPLERRLDGLAHRLVWVTLVLAAAVAAAGLATGRELGLTIQTAIALAVATIPEGLPVVATIALARGMWRMARRNALINRLSAVETLGATGVICTDKTGTLTENRMAVQKLELVEGRNEREALEIGALCNDAEGETGDPMEVALLMLGIGALAYRRFA